MNSQALRAAALKLRTSSMPLSDLIPLLQKTADRIDELETLAGEAYVVTSSLLMDMNIIDTDEAEKILDNLTEQKQIHKDVLPWPSFNTP